MCNLMQLQEQSLMKTKGNVVSFFRFQMNRLEKNVVT